MTRGVKNSNINKMASIKAAKAGVNRGINGNITDEKKKKHRNDGAVSGVKRNNSVKRRDGNNSAKQKAQRKQQRNGMASAYIVVEIFVVAYSPL